MSQTSADTLTQDLALASGPALNALAAAAEIRRDHLTSFGKLLRVHRTELLGLADRNRLTAERTYFQTNIAYVEALRELWAATWDIEGLLLNNSLQGNK